LAPRRAGQRAAPTITAAGRAGPALLTWVNAARPARRQPGRPLIALELRMTQQRLRRALRWSLALCLAGAASAAGAVVFAVNEGVTYRVRDDEVRARYALIAADLSRLLKQTVSVEPVGDYPRLRKGLADKAYDLAMVHPAHLSIAAMKHSGYRLVAVTKGYQHYQANFLVKPGSPLKSLADLKGRKVGSPDEDSITSWIVRATLRDALGDPKVVALNYTRYQDAVPFFVETTLTHAGATASNAVVKAWQAKGGVVLATSRAVPIKHVIAGPALSPEQVEKVREYLLSLDASEEGRRKLEPTQYAGFAAYDTQAMLDIGAWLGL
jgi:phosphonate transport system substrate-binding protein